MANKDSGSDELNNLAVLVEAVGKKLIKQVLEGKAEGLVELLWHVPTNILAEFLKRDS